MWELAKPGIVLVHGLWADASSFPTPHHLRPS
jgi:hypothetical protein